MTRLKLFFIPPQQRKMISEIVSEITKPSGVQGRYGRTESYHRGLNDGIKLVRQRAERKGINLDNIGEPDFIIREMNYDQVREVND